MYSSLTQWSCLFITCIWYIFNIWNKYAVPWLSSDCWTSGILFTNSFKKSNFCSAKITCKIMELNLYFTSRVLIHMIASLGNVILQLQNFSLLSARTAMWYTPVVFTKWEKRSGFPESCTNHIYSGRLSLALSNNVSFVKIYENYLVIHLVFFFNFRMPK